MVVVFREYIRAILFRKRWHVISLPLILASIFEGIDLLAMTFPPDIRNAIESLRPSVWLWVAAVMASVAIAHGWAWYDERKLREVTEKKLEETKENLTGQHHIELESKERDWELARNALEAELKTAEKRYTDLSEALRIEQEKHRLSHPVVMFEVVGDTPTGMLCLYNRGEIEAFKITVTELSCQNGIVYWRHPSRLPAQTSANVNFVIRNIGQEDNRDSSKVHNSANLIAQLLHIKYDVTEADIAKVFRPVERRVFIRYFDPVTKTNWQTPCLFVYDRKSGELTIHSEDAAPVPTEPMRSAPSELCETGRSCDVVAAQDVADGLI